jgi:hypothetical protein
LESNETLIWVAEKSSLKESALLTFPKDLPPTKGARVPARLAHLRYTKWQADYVEVIVYGMWESGLYEHIILAFRELWSQMIELLLKCIDGGFLMDLKKR